MVEGWLVKTIAFSALFTVASQALVAEPKAPTHTLSRTQYAKQLQGFWLGQSIANWTGIVTEMARNQSPFYTDEDWGKPAEASAWGFYAPHASRIEYYLADPTKVWGADDDTDIEYMYQHLLYSHQTSLLSPEQIRDGWLKHIYTNENAPLSPLLFQRENFLWVSNEKALYLMKEKGFLPPQTSEPEHNDTYDMIDAQLTTEIFGLFAPGRPDFALKMAYLPVRTTANHEAKEIADFYIIMHSLASSVDTSLPMKEQVFWLATQARKHLKNAAYPAEIYDFVHAAYQENPDKSDWEATRDAVYGRYQAASNDGYTYKQPFDAGINFASSLVSLFYGEGDIKETIRIGTLTGWDSDNPTATWGGLLGFMIGSEGVTQAFGNQALSHNYWIHRTRRNFPDYTPLQDGEDSFPLMAERGISIIDRVITHDLGGKVDTQNNVWIIPSSN